MEWFKWFIVGYFALRCIVLAYKSINHTGTTAIADIIVSVLMAAIAMGVWFWL